MPWHVTKSWQVHGHGVAHMSCGHSHAYSDVSLYCLQFAWHVSGGKCKFCIPVAWLAVKRASEIPTFKFQTWFFLMGHKGSQTSNATKKKRFRLRSFDYLRRHETGALTIDDTRCCDPGSMSIMLRSSRHALTGVLRTISHASSRFWLRAEPRGFRDVQLPDLLIECVDWRRSTRFIDI